LSCWAATGSQRPRERVECADDVVAVEARDERDIVAVHAGTLT
jgi:hypothetical protein